MIRGIGRALLCVCLATALASCRSVPQSAPPRSAEVVPLVTGTALQPSIPQPPHVAGRGLGHLEQAVLRSDALVPGSRVRIALFGGESIIATITQATTDGADRTWVATGDDTVDSVLIHYREGRFGFVARRPLAGDVEVSSCRDGDCVVTQYRPAAPLRCSTGGRSLSEVRQPSPHVQGADETIDILLLYTDAAVTGWAPWSDPQAALGDMETWVKETNLAFSCSGVTGRLRLAGAKRVGFAESGKTQADLEKWIDPRGHEWPVIDAARAEAGADLVSIVVRNGDDHGAANAYAETPHYDRFAVSVVVREAALGLNVFSHEVGHLLGAGHQQGEHGAAGFFAEDSYAWQFYSGNSEYVTLMFAGAASRIGHFSSPEVCYHSQPTGAAHGADNVRAIAYAAPKVSAFRTSRRTGPVAPISCPHDLTCQSRGAAPTLHR